MQMVDNEIARVYPWQQLQWNSLFQAKHDGRLPHALLLKGRDGLGKLAFALALSKSLLCLSPKNNEPCGTCNACHLFNANTHPDLHVVAPEEAGKGIKVDQIREMIEKNSLTSHISAYKIHLILHADRMNIAASNSLLKTLEEPSPNSLIILLSSNPELLSATIKSRCQQIDFQPPETSQAIQWLKNQSVKSDPGLLLSMAHGAPLAALNIDRTDNLTLRDEVFMDFGKVVFGKADPVKVAGSWENHDLAMILNWMTIWVIDMIRLKFNHSQTIIDNADKLKALLKIASVFTEQQLFDIYNRQLQAGRVINSQLNKLLLLESILIPWVAHNMKK